MSKKYNSPEEFDRLLDEHFSNDASVKRALGTTRHYDANPDKRRIGEKNPFYGKTHTEEVRDLIRRINTGLHAGENNPMYGKTHTEEVKQKSRDRNKIYYENNGGTFLGKKHTEETKKIMSEKRGTRSTVELKPCYAINPLGKKIEFNSIADCSRELNFSSLNGNSQKLLPLDGTPWKVQRGKWKGWTFGRII